MNTSEFHKFYNDLNIKITLENTTFSALNIVFEKFFRSIPMHSHSSNSYEIHYIAYGKGEVTVDGDTYEVVPNTLYITGPHVEHSQVPQQNDPMAEYCIYLKLDEKTAVQRGNIKRSLVPLFQKTKFWYGQDTQNIHAIMQSVFYELEKEYTGYMFQVEALLQQLIVGLIRNYERDKESEVHFEPSNPDSNQYLILEECFLYEYQDITLEKLAGRMKLSTRQTERLLQKHYHKTFLQKKTEAKMSAAVLLLGDRRKRITDISVDLGYSSVEHFSNAFKRYYLMSAREYRKKFY